ncbi:hypothetical protein EV401DRAFT_1915413 [Pisolithus croceorrhizus]|nr:hypothetical protein EV401DRAFT_1915413 [Pisolithus croceorrhizus]
MRNSRIERLSFVWVIWHLYQIAFCAPTTSTRTEGFSTSPSDGHEVKADARQDAAAKNSTTLADDVVHRWYHLIFLDFPLDLGSAVALLGDVILCKAMPTVRTDPTESRCGVVT